ncbi:MAG: hypothetical protein IPK28_00530 [Devosia sp.]|nr:hypothetical protein [Devosia sp.]
MNWRAILGFLAFLVCTSSATANTKVTCDAVDDVATVSHPSTIHVTYTESGRECHFTTALSSGSSSHGSQLEMDAQGLYESGRRFVLGRGEVDPFGEVGGVIAQFLVAPFLTEDLASSEDIRGLAEALRYDDRFLRECINSAFDGYGSGLDTVGNFTCGTIVEGGRDVPGFSLSVRSDQPVFVIAARVGYRVFAAFVPQAAFEAYRYYN